MLQRGRQMVDVTSRDIDGHTVFEKSGSVAAHRVSADL